MEALWDSLPETLRVRVDDLVLHDRRFPAIAALWQAGLQPRPALLDCEDLVRWRYQQLHDRIAFRAEPLRDVDTLLERVARLPWKPDAIEAVWDGDSQGWFVVLVAVRAEPRSEARLATIRHGGDLRLFSGQVPPWPETEEAARTGQALAGRLRVPFYFASPDQPELDVRRWWDSQPSR